MKKTLTGCLLMFLFFSSSAQHIEKTITISGYAGEQDTTIYEYESGPWSTYWSFIYISYTGYRLNVQHENAGNTCWGYLPLSDSWMASLPRDSYFYIKKLPKQVVPKLANSIDPSLQWLLETYSNQSIPDDTTITWQSNFNTHWIHDTLHIPDNYSLLVETDSLLPELTKQGYNKALILYHPWIHNYAFKNYPVKKDKMFEKLIKTDYGTVYTTGNGLVLKKGKKYRWIYINDGLSARYRGKMRWAPVHGITKTYKNYIAFTLCTAVDYKVYIINLETNHIYLIEDVLEKTILHDWTDNFSFIFNDNHLSFKTQHGELKIPLSKFE